MTQHFRRQHIANQLSDLRAMRGALSDMISTACGLIAQGGVAEVSDEIRLDFVLALNAAERADRAVQDAMKTLYDTPAIPKPANDTEAA